MVCCLASNKSATFEKTIFFLKNQAKTYPSCNENKISCWNSIVQWLNWVWLSSHLFVVEVEMSTLMLSRPQDGQILPPAHHAGQVLSKLHLRFLNVLNWIVIKEILVKTFWWNHVKIKYYYECSRATHWWEQQLSKASSPWTDCFFFSQISQIPYST